MVELRAAGRSWLCCPGARALTVLGALLVSLTTTTTVAQVALEQYQPAPLASDGVMLARPVLLAPHAFSLLAGIDYTNDPLVYRVDRGSRERQEVVADHVVVQLGGALSVHRRVMLFTNLPVHAVMRGDSELLVSNTKADGAALGDLSVGARVALLGDDASVFAVATELTARLPTAELAKREQHYAGAKIGNYEGALLAELRTGRLATRVRLGARLQREVLLQNLELGPALTFGVGLRAQLLRTLALHAELFGATYFSHAFRAQHTPVEFLLGPKLQHDRWWFGVAAGPGLVSGYGSPEFRVLASIGFMTIPHRPAAVPAPSAGLLAADTHRSAPEDNPIKARPVEDARRARPEQDTGRAQPELDVEFGHVEFGLARDTHAAASAPTLQAVQSILTLNTHLLRTRVEGHADDSKDAAANLELSRRRARAVTRWLIARGIMAARLELVACGARYPVATEPTEGARQKNRRVEFYVVDPAPKEPLAHPDCEPIELR